MSDEKKPETPQPKNHVEARRMQSEQIAKQMWKSIPMDPDVEIPNDFISLIERTLIMGEQRGINETVTRFMGHVNQLRAKMSFAPANHITQAVNDFRQWYQQSADFMTRDDLAAAKASGVVKEVRSDGKSASKIILPS